MSKFYIDQTTKRNDIWFEPGNDIRDAKEFADYTERIREAIRSFPGSTVRVLRLVRCEARDAEYWLTLALHDLKSGGVIREEGVTFARYYLREKSNG